MADISQNSMNMTPITSNPNGLDLSNVISLNNPNQNASAGGVNWNSVIFPQTPTKTTPNGNTSGSTGSSGTTALATTPVTTVPSATDIQTPRQVSVPPPVTPSATTPATSVSANVATLNASQHALLNSTDQGTQNAQDSYNTAAKSVQDLVNQYMGMGQDQLQQEKDAGVPQLQTTSNQLTQQYLSQQATYNQQYNDILNRPGSTAEQKAQEINDLQQQNGYNLTNTGIRQSIAQNDYDNAENLIQHQIQIKYGALKDGITFGMQFLANNKDILTAKQSQSFQANLAVQNQIYTQGVYHDQLNAQTSMQMIQEATANGAPQTVIDSMSKLIGAGASAGDVASSAGQYLTSGNYSMQFNPTTGQLEPYNAKTGQFKDGTPTSSTSPTYDPSSPTSASTVTSPTGTSYNVSTYATDPQYAQKLTEATSTIQSTVGSAISSPQLMQSAISSFAPTSPITGKMAYSAAVNNGMDPTVFAAQLKEESIFGTSTIAQADNNFGGITYTGSPQQLAAGITQGSARPTKEGGFYAKFSTAQAGLDYQAKLMSGLQTKPQPLAPGQTQTIQQKISSIKQIKASVPSYISSAIGFLDQTGDGYIDASLITNPTGAPNNYAENQAKQYASQLGLQYLSHDDVSAVRDANELLKNINNISSAWTKVAPDNISSRGVESITNPINAALATGNGQDLIAYNALVPQALSSINAIIGSKRLSKLSEDISTNSLPQVAHASIGGGITGAALGAGAGLFVGGIGAIVGAIVGGIGGGTSGGDTFDSGNRKLDNLRQAANATLTGIMQNSTGAPLSTDLAGTPSALGVTSGTRVTYQDTNYTVDSQGNLTSQ